MKENGRKFGRLRIEDMNNSTPYDPLMAPNFMKGRFNPSPNYLSKSR